MMKQTLPINAEQDALLAQLNPLQLAWLSGYCWAKANGQNPDLANLAPELTQAAAPTQAAPLQVTVISASQTGNAKGVADRLAERLTQAGVQVNRYSAQDYKAKNIAQEQIVFLITSTQGEGEPPEEGVVLYKFLHSKKAPKLDQLQFAVLGLGDSSYPNFCQAGKDFDQRFAELGAKRLLDRVDADLDFNAAAQQWIEQVLQALPQPQAQVATGTANHSANNVANSNAQYSKSNPYSATLLSKQKITGRESDKDVRHIELDLADSGLTYQAGDALGVWFENDPELVEEILALLQLSGDENIEIEGKVRSIRTALLADLELTQLTPNLVKGYAALAQNPQLNALVEDGQKLQTYVQQTPLVGFISDFPTAISAVQFAALLRPLAPRLYSIASSQQEVGEEVHLCVGVVRFEHQGKARAGAASSFLADRLAEDENVRIFVEHNDNFRLPQDNSKPIIMIGSGTGIAPFRAFVQQRAAEDAEGKNWLIFGNPHFSQDFLYQTEWQQWAKDGFLHQYDFAWSRDQAQKVYVQHKILEKSTAVWQWLQQGAYIYVCGDAAKMAKDVENALLEVIAKEGNLDLEGAEEFLNELREQKRYQRDVY